MDWSQSYIRNSVVKSSKNTYIIITYNKINLHPRLLLNFLRIKVFWLFFMTHCFIRLTHVAEFTIRIHLANNENH